MNKSANIAADFELIEPLNARELEILALFAEHRSNQEIADSLILSLNTVKWYARQIYSKLAVGNRREAVERAKRLGLFGAPKADIELPAHNLLAAATPFVGREAELDALTEFIADPHVRIITLTGPGGIGKTRLALETARRQIGPQTLFPDGIFFVALAPLESAEEILTTLAAVLDFHFQGSGNETEQLFNYLRNKRMLLVMDNFEHVLAGRTLLTQINERAAQITLIVTSRERLLLRGEQLLPLNGLETVESEHAPMDSSAAQLFLHIARRTVPDLQFHEGDAEQLNRICHLVEGMPLGLELAASWVGLLPLAEIATEIEQGLTLLVTRHHDVPQRHQSMQAMLDVSWSKLNPQQQRTFQALTLFRGGFTRTAALQVAGAGLPLLVTLVNKSWLAYDWQNDRYTIHELLRQYAAQVLAKNVQLDSAARHSHCQYYLMFLQQHDPNWQTADQLDTLHKIAREADNVNAAWRWALRTEAWESIFKALDSWAKYLRWQAHLAEGEALCRAIVMSMKTLLHKQPAHIFLWSKALAWQGVFTNANDASLEKLYQSLALLDRPEIAGQDQRRLRAFVLRLLGARYNGIDRKVARQHLDESLLLYQELNDTWSIAVCMNGLARLDWGTGHYKAAREKIDFALSIFKESGDGRMQFSSIILVGWIEQHLGNLAAAESLRHETIALCRQIGNRGGLANSTTELAYTQIFRGRFADGLHTAEQALVMSQEYGLFQTGYIYLAKGVALVMIGENELARHWLTLALDLAHKSENFGIEGSARSWLGFLTLAEGGRGQEAQRYFADGRLLYAEVEDNHMGFALIGLGYAACREQELEKARQHFVESLEFCQRLGDSFFLMQTFPGVALYLAQSGDLVRSVEIWTLACNKPFVANSKWHNQIVGQVIRERTADMMAETIEVAAKRGSEMDEWETAVSLLLELDDR